VITATQLVCHAIGDYLLQSDWMANEKTKRSIAALAHVLTYAIPFLFLRPSIAAMAFIIGTHFVVDRWRLARYVVWAKNFLAPPRTEEIEYVETGRAPSGMPVFSEHAKVSLWWYQWADCKATGYYKERPPWMAVWLMIVADNTMHVVCNGLALYFL
jgi:hypothetical protein